MMLIRNPRTPRLGLCCQFVEADIKFRTTTAAVLKRMPRLAQLEKLADICLSNAAALLAAIDYCAGHQIGCFRLNSQILPVKTHPEVGYDVEQLPNASAVRSTFLQCGRRARELDVRLCFHPDQFVVLNSPRPDVVTQSLAELEYQAEVAEWIGADVINIHAGGAYGDKRAALDALRTNLARLAPRVRERLTLENDDITYSPSDLLPLCQAEHVPLVYDVHHHRCLADGLSGEEATERAIATWNREPLFHLSSPVAGWDGPHPRRHHDYIDASDFPQYWLGRTITVEIEAKAKELAVARLLADLASQTQPVASGRSINVT